MVQVEPTPPQEAKDFWVGRGSLARNVSAVSPCASSSWYRNWTRRCLQDWTLRRVRAHLGPRIHRCVDLGCGSGDWTTLFAELSDEIIACDVSAGFAAEARRRLHAAGHPAATVRCGDVRTFDGYRDADMVYLGAVMTYLDDSGCAALLRDVRTRIRPGGVLLSRDWCAINLGRASSRTHAWVSYHRSPADYVALATGAGFQVVELARSPAIYGEQMACDLLARGSDPAMRWLRWAVQLPWYLATLAWTRASVSFVMKPV
jgi:SAM-dependent methyltransferase